MAVIINAFLKYGDPLMILTGLPTTLPEPAEPYGFWNIILRFYFKKRCPLMTSGEEQKSLKFFGLLLTQRFEPLLDEYFYSSLTILANLYPVTLY